MIITHLTTVHSVTDTRIFLKECQSLIKAGYNVSYLVPNTTSEIKQGVNVLGIQIKAQSRLIKMAETVFKLYKEAKTLNSDVYHFHDPEMVFVGLLIKLSGKKVIYDVHEDVPRQILSKLWISKILRKPISFVFEIIENFAAKKFDAIIAATPAIAERFKKYNNNTVTVQNFPLSDELIKTNKDDSVTNFNDKQVIYVGGITTIRGIKEMVLAVEQVNQTENIKLILAGKFQPSTLQSDTERLPGWQRVNFLGMIDRVQVKDNLSKAFAGLVLFHPEPNHINAQPNKLFEYMSAGVPVISSNFPLWKEIIEGNKCGLTVDPLSPEEIAEAIKYLAENKEEAKEMGRRGRKAVEKRYNWAVEESALLNLYKEILNMGQVNRYEAANSSRG